MAARDAYSMAGKPFNTQFFDAWSPEMAYVLGFMFADGYVYKNSNGYWYFCFCSTDLSIIEAIRTTLGSSHKIGVKKARPRFTRYKDLYVLQICSSTICRVLKSFGITPNKSLVMRFPMIPTLLLGDFIRGYFDGDGCVSFKRYWRKDREQWKLQLTARFTSGSRVFLEGLWVALKIYVKGGHINNKKRGYELVFGQHDAFALSDLMYNNVSSELFLLRKREIFRKAFAALRA